VSYISTRPLMKFEGRLWDVDSQVSGIYTCMMKSILGQLFSMLSHHNKLIIFRFDLRRSEHSISNKDISNFLRNLTRLSIRRYELTRFGYCWVREQELSEHQHYHFALFLDGNKIQSPHILWELVKKYWEPIGSPWLPKNSYYRISRDEEEKIQKVIRRLSYLAKGRGKTNRPEQTKSYGTSRILPRPKSTIY